MREGRCALIPGSRAPIPAAPPLPCLRLSPSLTRAQQREVGTIIQENTLLFVGLRPGEPEFESVIGLLQSCRPGELPSAYVAIPGGPLPDYLWQKWVWRGLLLFPAEPPEILTALEEHLP